MNEYARAGVDYSLINPFKRLMQQTSRMTLRFPNKRGVYMIDDSLAAHGALYEYLGPGNPIWCNTQEGLGNKTWIAEWMYANAGTGHTYYRGIPTDSLLMAANDAAAHGALPVVYTDEVATGSSAWFADEKRGRDIAQGFIDICYKLGIALPQGESPALRYLVNPAPPIAAAPSFSGCVTSIITPRSRIITGRDVAVGDAILGAPSSGIHANGISLIIERALLLPEQFLTRLPTGRTLGEEALIPTQEYVGLVDALLNADIPIHACLPATGSGLKKLDAAKRPFDYRIHSWVPIPPLMMFMREIGVPLEDCLTTFNWGVGYYIFVPPRAVERALEAGKAYGLTMVGDVQEGSGRVVVEPEKITLTPDE